MKTSDIRKRAIVMMDEIEKSLNTFIQDTGCNGLEISPVELSAFAINRDKVIKAVLNDISFNFPIRPSDFDKQTLASINETFDEIRWDGNGAVPTVNVRIRRHIGE
jgi:hypothetical protein